MGYAQHERYLNRELSLLSFHKRVLDMAQNADLPLLERLRYLIISGTNLDEFFEVRIGSLNDKKKHGLSKAGMDQANIDELREEIRTRVLDMVAEQYAILNNELLPSLAQEGVRIIRRTHWTDEQQSWLKKYMRENLMPIITPLGIDPAHPFPKIANKILHFIVSLEGKDAFGREHRMAIVPAPRALPRVVLMPESVSGIPYGFVLLSSIMHAFVEDLFPGMKVTGCYQFRLTRDSDLYLEEEAMADMKLEVQGRLQTSRRFGRAVRLEVADNCPPEVSGYLLEKFELNEQDLYQVNGLVNLYRLALVYDQVDRPDLKFKPFTQALPKDLRKEDNMFSILKKRDLLVHHPYQSFEPVIRLIEQAATDPDVLAIKQTLYRAGDQSRIADALCRAARNGKEVSAIVELRARFDEGDNILLAERLQQAGAHVVYGVVGFKTHCKMLMVVRREGKKIVRYCHLGTGNYHGVTTRFYTDFGLLTSDDTIGADCHKLFQQLTGLGKASQLKKIIQAPFDLHKTMLEHIRAEAAAAREGGPSRIIAKMNGLEDREIIDALYDASQAGVRIDLIVRGVCCLRPGLPGLSDNIRVRSVLGRFLEHERIFYFANQGTAKVYCSSADWLIRNLHHRVETAFPISQPALRDRVVREGLRLYLREKQAAWQLAANGSYKPVKKPEVAFAAQQALLLEICDFQS